MSETKKKVFKPFEYLDLTLRLEDVEEKWNIAKEKYKNNATADDVNEILKLSIDKIKILSELSLIKFES